MNGAKGSAGEGAGQGSAETGAGAGTPGSSAGRQRREPAWDDFRLVKAIADAGSLPAAARLMRLDHSTVFRRLKRLEEGFGRPLFERLQAGLAPTPAGEAMIEVAQGMEDSVAAFGRRVASQEIVPAGEVRLTTSDTIYAELLCPLLASFREACPHVRLDIVLANQGLNLSRRDADVAVRATSAPPDTLVGRRVAALPWAVYGAASLPDTALAAANVVSLGDDMAHLSVVRHTHATIEPHRVALRINTVFGLAEAIEAGIGIGHLPMFVGERRARLRRLAAPPPELATELWLLTHQDLKRVPRVRVLMDHLSAGLAALRPLIEGRASG